MIAQALALLWVGVSALLALEGLYYLWATLASRRAPRLPPAARLDDPPRVLVQVPVKDEGDVLRHALDAVARLDWPRDRLEVQVIDDSAPAGWETSARLVERMRAQGMRVAHMRGEPAEHKAGALRAGHAASDAPFVAILDADFAPGASFLRDTVPRLLADPRLACVQARWATRNADASAWTGAVALALDVHFLVEQRARARHGSLLSFVGTASVWRRDAIDEAGGWTGRTLAEDVDLGALALARGRRFALLEEPPVPQEVPETVGAFRSQQARWARGSMQCARLHAARVASAPLPWRVRAETLAHLTHYAVHPLVLALFLLQLARPLMAPVPPALAWALLAVALAGGAAPFVALASRTRGWARMLHLPALALLGLGISASNTRAVIAGLVGARGAFVRTPRGRARRGRLAVRPMELLLALVAFAAAPWLAWHGEAIAAAGAGLFGASFLVVAVAA